jgi:DNA-binding MarR family transcriptional regulator
VVASHVTVELGKLAKWGFVEKVRDVHDGRSILVALTKKGISAIEAVTPVTQSVNDGLFDGFAKSDFQKLDGLLEHFVCNAENTLSTALYEKEMAERQTAGKR